MTHKLTHIGKVYSQANQEFKTFLERKDTHREGLRTIDTFDKEWAYYFLGINGSAKCKLDQYLSYHLQKPET